MAADQASVDGRFQVTPLVRDAKDRFHISFEVVVTSNLPDISALTVLSRLGTQLGIHAAPHPAAVVRLTLDQVNRAMLPVTVRVRDAEGRETEPGELPALLVPPSSSASGVPLPYSAATVDDFPCCQQAWSDHDRAHQQWQAARSAQDHLFAQATAIWRQGMSFTAVTAALGFVAVLLQAGGGQGAVSGLVAVGATVIGWFAAWRIRQSRGLRRQAGSHDAAMEKAHADLLTARTATLERCPPSRWHQQGGCGCGSQG